MVGYSDFSIFDGRRRALTPPGLEHEVGPDGRSGESHYNPEQPRVPKGHPDGGQWTDDWGNAGDVSDQEFIRLASNDPPERVPTRRGRNAPTPRPPGGGGRGWLGLLLRVGAELISRYLEENKRPDLFGDGSDNITRTGRPKDGNSTAALTWLDGQEIYGTNSSYHLFTAADDAITKRMRDVLVRTNSGVMATGAIGRFPNAALFHAETNVLLRAAKANGGSLAGKTLEVVVNGAMCRDCPKVLPLVAWELGNPTVFFTNFNGVRHMVRDKTITQVSKP